MKVYYHIIMSNYETIESTILNSIISYHILPSDSESNSEFIKINNYSQKN